jgi:hypothetical protein
MERLVTALAADDVNDKPYSITEHNSHDHNNSNMYMVIYIVMQLAHASLTHALSALALLAAAAAAYDCNHYCCSRCSTAKAH